jgi:hypothetical protein
VTTANVNIKKVLLRRGNTVQNNNYTGVFGELTVDTQLKTLRVHDGVTAGGDAITASGAIGSYSNTNTAAYLASQSITSANIGAFQTFANANAASQTTEINSLRSNITAANAAIITLQSNAATQQTLINLLNANVTAANTLIPNLIAISSNIIPSANVTYSLGSSAYQWKDLWVSNNTIYIGNVPLTVSNGNLLVNGSLVTGSGSGTDDVLRANVGAYQTFANSNAATQATSINTVNANIGAYQTFANSNAATQATSINTINANVGAYQTFANSNAATQSTAIATLQTQVYANANVNTYLSSSIIGSLSTSGNLTVGGNLVVNGNSTIINTTSYTIEDNILQIADGNPADTLDLGFVGHRTVASTLQHTGLVRDASAGNWKLFSNVTAQPGNTIDFTNAVYDDLFVGNISANIVKNNYTWTFGTDGNLTVPASGTITAPNAQEFQLQARDTNSLLRNEINLDPNNGTYMSVWSEELETSFSTSDWATGSWENLEGVPGISGAFFTNAENLQDFWTTGSGSFVNSVEVSINGGARLPVSYDGNNGETYGALLLLTGVPATSPTTITSLTFYYRTQSSIDIDYNVGEILLDAQSIDIDLRTTNNLDLRAGQNLNIRGTGQYPVRIYTDNTTYKWEFDNTGSLTLPREGKIYGVGDGVAAGDRYGYISWAGNSSGDGSGFNTMRLVPDLQGLEDLDQYIIIDPTGGVPGHIHIRAGGTQDNSLADLYLGGEHSHVKISAGLNPPVTVMANDNSWNFGANANLTLPETGYLRVGSGIVAGFASSPAPVISGFSSISAQNFRFQGNGVNILSDLYANAAVQSANIATINNTLTSTNVAIGYGAGATNQGGTTVAVGSFAGQTTQGLSAVAVGFNAGQTTQGIKSVAIGMTAGYSGQGNSAVAIGDSAGYTSQGLQAIAIGRFAGLTSQSTLTVAVGNQAGETSQGIQATAVGSGAGNYNQSAGTVAIGTNAGAASQGLRAVAVGSLAGSLNQGEYAVALGNFAGGTDQGNNSIIINATGSSLDQTTANTFTVAPVRNDVANVAQILFYNTTSKEITYGNTINIAGNINANQYNFANGVNILSTVGAGSYGNTQVAQYLSNYDGGINFTSSTAAITNVDTITVLDNIRSPAYLFSNGVSIFDGITGGGGTTYTNANVVAMLAANSAVFVGNVGNVSTYSLQANNTQVFIGGNAVIASGNAATTNSVSLMHNMYFASNGTRLVRNTGAGVGLLSFDSTGFTVSGLVTVQTANSAPALPQWIKANTSGLFAPSGFTTSTITASGTVTVGGSGIQTSLTTFPLVNQTATTILFGGAATSISMGSATIGGSGSNVFVGNAIGTSSGNLTVRAFGTYNSVNSLNSAGGYATTTYTNIPVTGGSGTGMIISMSGVASGYLGSATVTNPGTGYRNGETITIPAGNPVGSLGGSFVIGNYNAAYLGQVLADYTFGIDGNLTLPGNVTIAGVGSIRYANGVSILSSIPTLVATNFSTANAVITGGYATGLANVTLTSGGNISGVGNIVGSTANTTITAGAYTSSFLSNGVVTTANVVASGNVTADYFSGNGSQLAAVATQVTGSWTVAAGSAAYSFAVPLNGTYAMWVRGNIPNGIITWNATATVTNNNVPVLGQQFAWNYDGAGTPIALTALPHQFVGTSNTIITTMPSVGTSTNTFTFTINNTSGSEQTVYWGYTKL